jgi:hypothetical protein
MFLIREWAGTKGQRYWAMIRWGRNDTKVWGGGAVSVADNAGACLDCEARPTKAAAVKLAREYARKLGLQLPGVTYR